ncbi:MAG: TetR family transcriptional regulator [Calditrichia bacterium]
MRRPDLALQQRRREEILAAAAKLFAEKNYHEVLVNEVAELAGMAKGSVYLYFSTKEELYVSIMAHRMAKLLELLQKRIDNLQTPLINLRRIIIHIYNFMAKYPHFFKIWYREKLNCQKSTHQQIHQFYIRIKQILETTLQRGEAEGILQLQSIPFSIDMIIGIIETALFRSVSFSEEERREESLRVYCFILKALGTPKALQMHLQGLDEPQPEEMKDHVFAE